MIAARALSGLLTGTLFGLGLAVSQMANPEKVLAFLRVIPGWDPSLVLVMAAATSVTLLGYRWVMKGRPLFDTQFRLPASRQIDWRLLSGAVIFGAGWGLAGYCPGPAIAGIASGATEPVVFVIAMLVGSQIARLAIPPPAPAIIESKAQH